MIAFHRKMLDTPIPGIPGMVAILSVASLTLMAFPPGSDRGSAEPGQLLAAVVTPESNPHGTRTGCSACHASDTGSVNARPPDISDALCIRCHDGKHAKAEDHPVGRSFNRTDIRLPDGFPAADNKLTCLTCHDVLSACRLEKKSYDENPMMLRGPVAFNTADYCTQCHIPDTHRKHNPHQMLSVEGTPGESACRACHTNPIPTAQSKRTNVANLRLAEPDLCLGCHPAHLDFFDPGHTGAAVTDAIRAALLRADQRAGLSKSEHPQLLPLSPQRRVTCSTCHNPHQAGLFESGSVLERGSMPWPKSTLAPVPLRLQGRELCNACHGY
jgi:hypothetical protein